MDSYKGLMQMYAAIVIGVFAYLSVTVFALYGAYRLIKEIW